MPALADWQTMTADEIYNGKPDRDPVAMLLDWMDSKITDDEFFTEPTLSPHGKCIGYRWEAYHDVHIYEDGYEEWDYIGD